MNENQMPEQDEVALNAVPEPGEPETPPALQAVDPEKLRALREKLKKFASSGKTTISGSEAPPEPEPNVGPVLEGKDVDWSEYDLEFSVRHLYPQSRLRPTPEGPRWVAVVDEFFSTERSFKSHGQKVHAANPGAEDEPLNLGEYLNDMLNSPEGWALVSLLPASVGRVGVLLRRGVPVVLPDPKPLKKETEVEAPKDPELEDEQAAAQEFMEREGVVSISPSAQQDPDAFPPRTSLEAVALALNGPAERDPAQARTLEAPMDEAAGVVAEAALQGEDFGADPSAVIGQESNAGIHAEQSEFGAPPAVEG